MTHSNPMPTSHPSPRSILAAAAASGLDLTTDRTDLDATGLDFFVVHARDATGAPWIVRAPRRTDVREAAQREARVLRLVRPVLPVAVPDWRVHTPEVIAYPRLDGTPAWTFDASGGLSWALDPQALSGPFLDSYAAALAALQSVGPERARDAGVRVESIDDAREEMARAIDETRGELAPPEAVWARWQRWLEGHDAWPRHAALAHGDLHPGHLLLDGGGRVVAILDWTEARVTDPSVDLALFHGCFGRSALEAMVLRLARAGADVEPGLVPHTIERWAAYPALVAAWAMRTSSEAAMAHARAQLAAIATTPAPGDPENLPA